MKYGNNNRAHKPLKIGGGIILGLGIAVLLGFIIMWLWNALMPEIFGLSLITFWQGLGMALLARLIFGGVGGGNGSRSKKEHIHAHVSSLHGDYTKNWSKYDEWWTAEGKASFENYGKEEKSDEKE